jgi:hypothetical protein
MDIGVSVDSSDELSILDGLGIHLNRVWLGTQLEHSDIPTLPIRPSHRPSMKSRLQISQLLSFRDNISRKIQPGLGGLGLGGVVGEVILGPRNQLPI